MSSDLQLSFLTCFVQVLSLDTSFEIVECESHVLRFLRVLSFWESSIAEISMTIAQAKLVRPPYFLENRTHGGDVGGATWSVQVVQDDIRAFG